MKINWEILTPEQAAQLQELSDRYMPEELRKPCPYCKAGVGQLCMTRGGNWTIHKRRRLIT